MYSKYRHFFFSCLAYTLGAALLGSWQGCSNAPEQYNLTAQERSYIDTVYLKEVSKIRPTLDSTCIANHEGLVSRLLDSLLIERRQEEIKLRQRMIQRGLINKDGAPPVNGAGQ